MCFLYVSCICSSRADTVSATFHLQFSIISRRKGPGGLPHWAGASAPGARPAGCQRCTLFSSARVHIISDTCTHSPMIAIRPRFVPPLMVMLGLQAALAAWLTVASAYECDPGRSNVSVRAPCSGWPAGGANTTLCEVELGCCWESVAGATAGAGVTCWAPQGRPARLPRITNPALKWLGFFGQPYADEAGYEPAIQHTFATFGAASDLPTLAAGAALGMTSLFRTQLFLVQHGNWTGPVDQRGHRLFPDYRQRWQQLATELQPWVANGTVRGFHIGDELVWGGLPYADLDAMATMMAATPWGEQAAAEQLIVFSNEAAGPIVRDETCFKQPAGYLKVPAAISWISFDFYNPPGGFVKNECACSRVGLQLQSLWNIPTAAVTLFCRLHLPCCCLRSCYHVLWSPV